MIAGIAAVFLLNFGLVSIIIINKFGLIGGITVAMLPTWQPLPKNKTYLEQGHQVESKSLALTAKAEDVASTEVL